MGTVNAQSQWLLEGGSTRPRLPLLSNIIPPLAAHKGWIAWYSLVRGACTWPAAVVLHCFLPSLKPFWWVWLRLSRTRKVSLGVRVGGGRKRVVPGKEGKRATAVTGVLAE